MRGRGRTGASRRKSPVPRLASDVSTHSPMRGRGRGAARRKSPVPRLASEVSTQSPNPGEAARQRACEGPTPKLSAAMSTPDAIWGINDHGFGACPLANPPVVSQVDAAVNTKVFSSRPDRGRAGASRPGRSGNVPSYLTGRREFGPSGPGWARHTSVAPARPCVAERDVTNRGARTCRGGACPGRSCHVGRETAVRRPRGRASAQPDCR
jgi:hypothetical protein